MLKNLTISLNKHFDNFDSDFFGVGTETGFKIFRVASAEYCFQRETKTPVKLFSLLSRSNIFAFVGDGSKKDFPSNKVCIWDDFKMKIVAELIFRENIFGIYFSSDKFIVVTNTETFVLELKTLKQELAIKTQPNPLGCCSVTGGRDNLTLVIPSQNEGYVKIIRFKNDNQPTISELKAHEHAISKIEISSDAKLLATASQKGTIIRVFDIEANQKICELRRGKNTAEIYSMCFGRDNELLAVTSSSSTIHIFEIGANSKKDTKKSSWFGMSTKEIKSSYKSHLEKSGIFHISCFNKNNLNVIFVDGSFFEFQVDTETKKLKKIIYTNFEDGNF
ncbi:wd-repeat protein interacting with phosphoinosides wipi -related [Anaeramoeba ignava]|uniref:Wd-repeat protein interacting with phosphoinosides wipi -related n=1 Tax=Anaeramoeba ignava TaxID=1746090 RepID=A0A9Q0LFV3_ANAIG|nr:wd-repeat protein interacting with phosphoinosides wipi -related [Anaeramoeba ignava]